MRTIGEITNEIENFNPIDEYWLPLEDLLNELWEQESPQKGIKSLFKIFEKFPTEDGFGVFWSILHGIETFKNYEHNLIESLNFRPSLMGIIMLNRLENSSPKKIEIDKILELKESIKKRPQIEKELINQLI